MRSLSFKGALLFLIALSMAGYLFHTKIPTVNGVWTNPVVSITPESITTSPGSVVAFYVNVGGFSDPDTIYIDVGCKYHPTNEFSPP